MPEFTHQFRQKALELTVTLWHCSKTLGLQAPEICHILVELNRERRRKLFPNVDENELNGVVIDAVAEIGHILNSKDCAGPFVFLAAGLVGAEKAEVLADLLELRKCPLGFGSVNCSSTCMNSLHLAAPSQWHAEVGQPNNLLSVASSEEDANNLPFALIKKSLIAGANHKLVKVKAWEEMHAKVLAEMHAKVLAKALATPTGACLTVETYN